MSTYSAGELLRVAKRYNNSRRGYLLVNPLQAKHLPADPARSLEMMGALGAKLARAYPECRLVIGFAETATAIGAAAASCFPDDCVYVHTTREDVPEAGGWISFLEEHSHAAQQKLCVDLLADRIGRTEQVIFVDDEISTGKTLINMVGQLRERVPALKEKRLVAASILNRLSGENEQRLSQAGVRSECLLKLACEDYSELVRPIEVREAVDLRGLGLPGGEPFQVIRTQALPDPRRGVEIGPYRAACQHMAERVVPLLRGGIPAGGRVLVLGTEEYMYPALILGRELGGAVFCHATTRSPIGISRGDGYPITEGYRLHSFYAGDRETYIYNLERYDAAIIVTDSRGDLSAPLRELGRALRDHGCGRLFLVQNGGASG